MHNKLVLGTAQLGMDYGIANQAGQPSLEKSYGIISTAWDKGIRCFDTAQGYGSAEKILGRALKDLGVAQEALIISKVSGSICKAGENNALNAINKSLKALNINTLYGLLLHGPKNLASWDNKAERIMEKVKKEGMAKKIGISVYRCEDAIKFLRSDIFDMVQMPFNLFDQSFFRKGVSALAGRMRKLVFIRSIFLQGLLLMNAGELRGGVTRLSGYLLKRDSICREFRIDKKELAIGYVKKRAGGAYIIFGAENQQQVSQTADIFAKTNLKNGVIRKIEEELAVGDENLINPSKWNRQARYG